RSTEGTSLRLWRRIPTTWCSWLTSASCQQTPESSLAAVRSARAAAPWPRRSSDRLAPAPKAPRGDAGEHLVDRVAEVHDALESAAHCACGRYRAIPATVARAQLIARSQYGLAAGWGCGDRNGPPGHGMRRRAGSNGPRGPTAGPAAPRRAPAQLGMTDRRRRRSVPP